MVVGAIMASLSLAVTQIIRLMSRGSKKMQQDFDSNSIYVEARTVLSNKQNCTDSLQGLTVSTTPFSYSASAPTRSLKKNIAGTTKDFLTVADTIGTPTQLWVKDIILTGYYVDATSTFSATEFNTYTFFDVVSGTNVTRRSGKVELALHFSKVNLTATPEQQKLAQESSFGSLDVVRRIYIDVVTDTSDVIQECFGSSDEYVSAACGALGGRVDSDGFCKNVILRNNNTMATFPGFLNSQNYTFQTEGSAKIMPDPLNPAGSGQGSVGIGKEPNNVTASNLDVAGSIGVGTQASSGVGSIQISGGLGVGTAQTNAGSISATGNVDITGGLGVGTTAPGAGNITASGNITATGTVTGSIICGAAGCATRFGRQQCPAQQNMVGIYDGQIACAADTSLGPNHHAHPGWIDATYY